MADTGQTPYTAAAVTDDLTGILDDAAYNHGLRHRHHRHPVLHQPDPDLDR